MKPERMELLSRTQISSTTIRHRFFETDNDLLVEVDEVTPEDWTEKEYIVGKIIKGIPKNKRNKKIVELFPHFMLHDFQNKEVYVIAVLQERTVNEGMLCMNKFIKDAWQLLDKFQEEYRTA